MNATGAKRRVATTRSDGRLCHDRQGPVMDASKQATGKDEGHKANKEHRDDVKKDAGEGRYEGGRDSDQNRQAKDRGQGHEKAPTEPATPGKDRRGMEEEE